MERQISDGRKINGAQVALLRPHFPALFRSPGDILLASIAPLCINPSLAQLEELGETLAVLTITKARTLPRALQSTSMGSATLGRLANTITASNNLISARALLKVMRAYDVTSVDESVLASLLKVKTLFRAAIQAEIADKPAAEKQAYLDSLLKPGTLTQAYIDHQPGSIRAFIENGAEEKGALGALKIQP